MNFQDDISSIPNDKFEDCYILVFGLNSMQDAIEICHYHELVEEPLLLDLYFSFPVIELTKLIVLGERMSSDAVDKIGIVGKNIKNG